MNRYFDEMVLSASPMELIRLLYQNAITSTQAAREHLKAGRISERSHSINNAYLILAELIASLQSDVAPELTARLVALYGYMQSACSMRISCRKTRLSARCSIFSRRFRNHGEQFPIQTTPQRNPGRQPIPKTASP
jgi:hypothetical protein